MIRIPLLRILLLLALVRSLPAAGAALEASVRDATAAPIKDAVVLARPVGAALLDMAGLDIYQAVAGYLNQDLSARADVSPWIAARTAAGALGLKTGRGVFDYAGADLAALRAARARKFVATRRALEESD